MDKNIKPMRNIQYEPSEEKDVTSLYGTMIEAFSADFQLSVNGHHKLKELDTLIADNNVKICKDIELLDKLDYGIRYGKLKIIEVNEQ